MERRRQMTKKAGESDRGEKMRRVERDRNGECKHCGWRQKENHRILTKTKWNFYTLPGTVTKTQEASNPFGQKLKKRKKKKKEGKNRPWARNYTSHTKWSVLSLSRAFLHFFWSVCCRTSFKCTSVKLLPYLAYTSQLYGSSNTDMWFCARGGCSFIAHFTKANTWGGKRVQILCWMRHECLLMVVQAWQLWLPKLTTLAWCAWVSVWCTLRHRKWIYTV